MNPAEQFFAWLALTQPVEYQRLMELAPHVVGAAMVAQDREGLAGLGESDFQWDDGRVIATGSLPSVSGDSSGLLDQIGKILGTLLQTQQQKKIMDLQIERAKKGLPPLDTSALGVGVNVGVSPQIEQMMKSIMVGGLAIGGGFLLLQALRKR